MSKRIKLAEEIQVLKTDDFLYYVIFGKPDVIKDKAIKKAEQLKQQIIDDQEKAKKLDSYHYEKQVEKLQDEVKKLKEFRDEDARIKSELRKKIKQLKEDYELFKKAFIKSEGERIGYKLVLEELKQKLKKILEEK